MSVRTCPECRRFVEDWWSYCPWCGKGLPARMSLLTVYRSRPHRPNIGE